MRERGFLREYVWTYLRDPNWRNPEPPLMAEFAAWAAEVGLDSRHQAPVLAMAIED